MAIRENELLKWREFSDQKMYQHLKGGIKDVRTELLDLIVGSRVFYPEAVLRGSCGGFWLRVGHSSGTWGKERNLKYS